MQFEKYQRYLLAILSGVILNLAWTEYNLGFSLFVALVPLFIIEDYLDKNRHRHRSVKAFNYSFIAFVVWNALSTFWIYHASLFGAIMAVIINSLVLASCFWGFHIVKRKLGAKFGYFGLIVFWIASEYMDLNWDLSWPWMILGNGFAKNVSLIQWYEYTGVLGGSFWVLLSNIMIYQILKKYIFDRSLKGQIANVVILAAFIFVPIIYSLVRYSTYEEKENPKTVVVVQPNIDPYNEKFGGMTAIDQLNKLLALADSLTDDSTDYVVGPETALVNSMWEEDMEYNSSIRLINKFIVKYPKVKFIAGLSSRRMYKEGEELSITARKYPHDDLYYESYNTAMQIDSSKNIQLYHKSKLVPGVELIPFPSVFGYFEKFAIDLGGSVGSYGSQNDRSNFIAYNNTTNVAPAICYESIYGEFLGKYVQNGANFIFIITNDGWWEDTPGYKQHMSFARLRAIELRRSIARSANTGISCFINQRGDVIQPTSWWTPNVIKATINSNDKLTFYAVHGDYFGRIAAFFTLIVVLYMLASVFVRRKK